MRESSRARGSVPQVPAGGGAGGAGEVMAIAEIVTDNGGGDSGQTSGGHPQEAPNWSPVPPPGTPNQTPPPQANSAGGPGGAVPSGNQPGGRGGVAEGDGAAGNAVQIMGDPARAAALAQQKGGGQIAPVAPDGGGLMAFLTAHKSAILLGLLAGLAALLWMNRKKQKTPNPSRKVRHHKRRR